MACKPQHFFAQTNVKQLPGPPFCGEGIRKLKQLVMDPNFGAHARNLTALNTLHRLASR